MIQNYKLVKKDIKKYDAYVCKYYRQDDDRQGHFVIDLENVGAEQKHYRKRDVGYKDLQEPRKSPWESFEKIF